MTWQVLTEAITGSDDANPLVKDITLTSDQKKRCSSGGVTTTTSGGVTTTTSGGVTTTTQLEAGGACWKHVHRDELNVYDFTLWASEHPGNNEKAGFLPIKTPAYRGEPLTACEWP